MKKKAQTKKMNPMAASKAERQKLVQKVNSWHPTAIADKQISNPTAYYQTHFEKETQNAK